MDGMSSWNMSLLFGGYLIVQKHARHPLVFLEAFVDLEVNQGGPRLVYSSGQKQPWHFQVDSSSVVVSN